MDEIDKYFDYGNQLYNKCSQDALTQHVAVGTHFYKPTTVSKLDTIALKWALKVAVLRGMDERIVGAWAVKSTERRKRLSADVKQFVLLEFYYGSASTAVLIAALVTAALMAA